MLTLREATLADLDFLVRIDLKDEGVTAIEKVMMSAEEAAAHRTKIRDFVVDPDKAAWVIDDIGSDNPIGMILWRYRNRLTENFETWSVFGQLDRDFFPEDGAFSEIFQLWVAPQFRRNGLATRLKQKAESEALQRGVRMIYTHTEAQNLHVIDLNMKLGYREVRRGPIWDEVVRVSLIKRISLPE